MSVFTNTQGRPAGVRALVGLLAAFPDGLTLPEIEGWMIPGLYRSAVEDEDETRDGRKNTSIANTLGAARSLDLVDDEGGRSRVRLEVAERVASDFHTLIHERFTTTTQAGDRLLVALYAFLVCRTQQENGAAWLAAIKTRDLVDQATKAFADAGDEYSAITFNKDRMPAWKDWASYIGLGFEGLPGVTDFFLPEASTRVGIELEAIGASISYEARPAVDIVARLAARCPYLDGGSSYRAIAKAVGAPEEPSLLSPTLSRALRELRDAGRIAFEAGGDTVGALKLVGDAIHPTEPVGTILIAKRPERTA